MTSVIEACEGREVATCDTPNAFIQTDAEEEDRVTVGLVGETAESLVKTAPEPCRSSITVENWKNVSCVEALKAIHVARSSGNGLSPLVSRSIPVIHVWQTR